MAKDVLKITDFSGGQNDNSDPRDLKGNESAEMVDFHGDEKGLLTPMGRTKYSPDYGSPNGTVIKGYGVHTYNSGYGMTPSSGVKFTHTHVQDPADGTAAMASPCSIATQASNSKFGQYVGNILTPTSVEGYVSTGNHHYDTITGWDHVAIGIFAQKWEDSNGDGTFEISGNPVPLFGTAAASSEYKLSSDTGYSTGTLHNGSSVTAHKWNSDSGTVTTYTNASGGSTSYSASNWLVVLDENDDTELITDMATLVFGTGFDSSPDNNINYVAGQTIANGLSVSFENIGHKLTTAIHTAINRNTSVSGFVSEVILTNEDGGNDKLKISRNSYSGETNSTIWTFFSNYQRTDDSNHKITALTPGSGEMEGKIVIKTAALTLNTLPVIDIIDAGGTGQTLGHAHRWSVGGLFGGENNHEWANHSYVYDLIMIAGNSRKDSDTGGSELAHYPSGKPSLGGTMEWNLSDRGLMHLSYPGAFGEDTSLWSGNNMGWQELGEAQELNYASNIAHNTTGYLEYALYYFSALGSSRWIMNEMPCALGKGNHSKKQKETLTASGTPASGDAWNIDINGTTHTVTYGDTEADGGTLTTSLTEWADEFADDIEAGAQAGAVAATSVDEVLTIESTTGGVSASNTSFSFASYSDANRTLEKVDDERIAYINQAGKLQIYSNDLKGWYAGSAINTLGWSGTTAIRPVFYSEGGALRMSDGNFSNNNESKVVNYFETGDICGVPNNKIVGNQLMNQDLSWRINLSDSTSKNSYTMQSGNASGTMGIIRAARGSTASDFTNWENDTNLTGQRWKFTFKATTDTGGWFGKHRFFASAVYFDGSESLPTHSFTNANVAANPTYDDDDTNTVWDFGTDGVTLEIRQVCHPGTYAAGEWLFDERMRGIRLYHAKEDDNYGIYYHLGMVDFVHGFRDSRGSILSEWSREGSTARYTCTGGGGTGTTAGNTGVTIYNPNEDDTFEYITGYDSNSTALAAKYATATITGRRAWIGNVSYVDETGNERVHNDRIIASPPNMFDIFPTPYGVIDVDTSDGDGIVALHSAHGRLLQFKQRHLYIINVADSDLTTAFLESSHNFKGVSHTNHVVEVDDGIAWANNKGVYVYRGDDIENLMVKDEGDSPYKMIEQKAWQNFFSDDSMVIYSPLDNQLIIKKSITGSENDAGDVYMYSFNTESWAKGLDRMINNKDCTNFIVMQNGDVFTLANVAGDDTTDGGSIN